MRAEDRRVMVTGAASGIGEATARRFAADGARVALVDVDVRGVERVAADLRFPGAPTVAAIGCDVSDHEAVVRAVDAVVEQLGGLDVVISNAGVGAMGTLDSLGKQEWDRVVGVNLTGAFHVAKYSLAALRNGTRASLLFTSSAGGTIGTSAAFAYNATKAAINNMVRSLAIDLGPAGIRVNCVCPGPVSTPTLAANARATGLTTEELARMTVPLGRVCSPDEVAGVFAWLASDAAAYVTGQAIVVDGAMTSGLYLAPPAAPR